MGRPLAGGMPVLSRAGGRSPDRVAVNPADIRRGSARRAPQAQPEMIRASANTGVAAVRLSMRSITPPWPGNS